jgi:hypothetical protein
MAIGVGFIKGVSVGFEFSEDENEKINAWSFDFLIFRIVLFLN